MLRKLDKKIGTFLLAAGLAATAWAQGRPAPAFPAKPVKIIVAAAAGSSPDAIARTLATKLGAAWGQPVLIENVAGLGGVTGTERAAKAPADGHTLVVSTIGAIAVAPGMMEKMPYDPVRDLAPVSLVMSMPNLLVVHPSVPATNVRELVAYARQNPGKLRYGHPGSGTTPHLSAELLGQMVGVKLQGVPYKSSAQMTTDLLGGHYEVLFHNTSVVLPHARAGAARVLGITSAERNPAQPDIPTVAEAGGLPGFAVNAWWGLYAPAGVPGELVAKISADVAAALAQPDVKAWIEQQGGVAGGGTPQALRAFQAAETQKWRDLVKAANIQPD
ncbi:MULTISPECIES: Bug family tripartite tricarboxylate transporter substrate binding protein [Ramlibacter]|nr:MULTISPECIES: tripartite tricarboxylate transporter substrate binding protein [Ramlibacter]MBA2962021.1 tripartite tricarboxylate transporter substrate binding protein [Ramlibacter sp. CGMCC 1.13660]